MSRFRAWLRATAKRLHVSDSGVSAIEFAFVGGPFLLFLGCMFETGIMLFSEYTLQAAVQKASREVRTGTAQNAQTSAVDFKAKICGGSTGVARFLMDCSKVMVYMKPDASFSSLNANTPETTAIGKNPDDTDPTPTYNCGQSSQPMTIIATYDYKFAFPFMSTILGNVTMDSGAKYRRIAGMAIFRNEPFDTSNSCS